MGNTDRRRFTRRIKSIRFRFTADGEERRAVTTTVGPGGAFLKASYIPRVGTTLTLHEVYNRGAPEILLRAEVRWTVTDPTLERPDTGFGVAFLELFTREDPSTLEDFLRYLAPDLHTPDIQFEERSDGVYAVYRFAGDASLPLGGAQLHEPESLDEEELPSVDLERELARLEREARGDGGDVSPTQGSGPEASEAPLRRRTRSRRRSVTGIFTALFSRRRGDHEPGFDDGPDAFLTPAGDHPGDDDRRRGAQRPEVALSWNLGRARAHVDTLERAHALLRSHGPQLPAAGDRLRLTPIDAAADQTDELELCGVVDQLEQDDGGGARFTVRFEDRMDPAREARFERWLRAVNGPR